MSASLIDKAAFVLRSEHVRHLVAVECRKMDEVLHKVSIGSLPEDAASLQLASLEDKLAILRRQLGNDLVDSFKTVTLCDIERELEHAGVEVCHDC